MATEEESESEDSGIVQQLKTPGASILQELATYDPLSNDPYAYEDSDLPDGTHNVTLRKRERW